MTELYLLRHGIAVPHGTPDVPEDDRPLTSKGERRMRQIGRGLRRLGLDLDRIVTSPLPRARRTAEIVAEALGISDRLEEAEALRAGRGAAEIREWVVARPEARLMIVGHDPAFSDLIGLLAGAAPAPRLAALKKGGIAAFSTRPDGTLQLDWLATPRLFRRLGGS